MAESFANAEERANRTAALPTPLILCSVCSRSVNAADGGSVPDLTERQQQCLSGVLERKTAKQIGRTLGITHHAVEQHLKAARRKLGAADTLEAARTYARTVTTVGPYYATAELPRSSASEHQPAQSKRHEFLLRDVATDKMGIAYRLTARQTLVAIGLSSVGVIAILALIVAVAEGVAQLAP